jgi:hypothetical protein
LDADDAVVFAAGLGGVDSFAFGALAFLFRPLAAYDSTNRTLLAAYDSTGAQVGKIGLSTANKVQWFTGGSGGNGPTVTAGDWHALIVRKATGTEQARFSLLNVASGWTHVDTVGTFGDWTAPTGGTWSTSDITFGWGPGSDYAAVAVWANVLPWAADTFGDAEIEAAGLEDHLDNWRDAAPTAGWAFFQADVNVNIEDWTLDRADEISVAVGAAVDATDLAFQYEDTGLLVLSRNFLRTTQDEPGAGGTVRDLSETQGTPTTLGSGTTSSGGYTKMLEWVRTVGATVGSATIPTQLQVTAVSAATLAYKWQVHRYDSAGVLQADSDFSGEHNTTGIKVATLTLDTTWSAGDRLGYSLWLRKASGGGSRSITVAVNDADSWAEFEVAAEPPAEIDPAAPTVGVTSGTLAITTGAVGITPAAATVTATPGVVTIAATAAVTPAATTVTTTPGTVTVGEVEPFPVRDFGSGDRVAWGVGTGGLDQVLFGAFTVAAICRRTADTDQGALLNLAAGVGGSRGFFRYTDDDEMDYLRGQFQSGGVGPSWTPADGWVLVAFTTAGGTAVVRYHKYVFDTDTWTHANSAGTVDDDDNTCDRAETRFQETAGWVFQGRYAVMGVWGSALSDVNLEALTTQYTDWVAATPMALWRFDQGATTTAIDDQTAGGADQTALTGSTVVDDPVPGFTFGEGVVPGAVTVTATPGGLTITSNVAVTPAPATATATPGTLTLTTTAAATPVAVTVTATPGTVELAAESGAQPVTPGVVTLTAAPGTLGLALDLPLTGHQVTATPGSLAVTRGLTVSPVGAAVSITPAGMVVSTGVAAVVPAAVTLTAAAGDLSLAVGITPGPVAVSTTAGSVALALDVPLTGAAVAATPGAAMVGHGLIVTMAAVVVTATAGAAVISVGVGVLAPAVSAGRTSVATVTATRQSFATVPGG